MIIDLTFDSVCKLVKKDHVELIEDIDALAGLVFLASVALTGNPVTATAITSAIGTLSNLFTVKSEFTKIGKRIIEKISSKKDNDPLAQLQRMKNAYCLICYTAFFEALSREKKLAHMVKKVKLTPEDKLLLSNQTLKGVGVKTTITNTSDVLAIKSKDAFQVRLLDYPLNLPHPADSFNAQCQQLLPLYTLLSQGMQSFLENFAVWDETDERERSVIKKTLAELPQHAVEHFRAQYYFLAATYQDFYVWSNLQEREETRTFQKEMSEFTQKYIDLAKTSQTAIDLGFHYLSEVVRALPEQVAFEIATGEVSEAVNKLQHFYIHNIEKPIIESKFNENGKPQLIYPKRSEIFIPQAFQSLRYSTGKLLEDSATWSQSLVRDDLGAFLLSYLRSPYSYLSPLIILGQPGSGKSLLTSMLSARLMLSPAFTPVRVELRNTNADADIQTQIEEQIRKDSGWTINWGKFSRYINNRPALVLFDGYDELLQASGKVFADYLLRVKRFQEREYDNDRPVPTIVTSRITLIDKAAIPDGATIIQLKEFDPEKQKEWISVWNATNASYFLQMGVESFELPPNDNKINDLAEQPLLLTMLALYDSKENQLRKTKNLDRTFLYNSLLRQFIEREKMKGNSFEALSEDERNKAIERDMERLGVAAIGMFNRRNLSIQSTQLDRDLAFFKLEHEPERKVQDSSGRIVSQAEFVLGSFFFVQESQAVQKDAEKAQDTQKNESSQKKDTAFEFLHNTFGEFLAADFILRKVLQQTNIIHKLRDDLDMQGAFLQRTTDINGLPEDWFASLMYAPLFSRPVILSLMREWLKHCLQDKKRDEREFQEDLGIIVNSHIKLLLTGNTLPAIMTERGKYAFGDLPITGYLAMYSLNLLTLVAVLSTEGFIFEETTATPHYQDRARAWSRLTYLWRSWFSLETLNGLTAILTAEREGTTVHLKAKENFGISSRGDQLGLVFNVSRTLADHVTAGLAGFLLHDSYYMEKAELDDIERMLTSEQLEIDLRDNLLVKQLRNLRQNETVTDQDEFFMLNKLERWRWNDNPEDLASLLAEIAKSIGKATNQSHWIGYANIIREILRFPVEEYLLPTDLAIEMIKAAKMIGNWDFLERLRKDYTKQQRRFERPLTETLASELIKLEREAGSWKVPDHLGLRYLEKVQDFKGNIHVELVIEAIRLALGVGDISILDYFSQDYLKEMIHLKRYLPEELAVEVVKLAHNLGVKEVLDYFKVYLFDLIRPQRQVPIELAVEVLKFARDVDDLDELVAFMKAYLREIKMAEIRLPVELAVELMKLTRDVGDHDLQVINFIDIDRMARVIRWLPTELAVGIIRFVRMTGRDNETLLAFLRHDYLEEMMKSEKRVPVELAVELIILAEGIENQASVERFYRKNFAIERCILGSLRLDTLNDLLLLAERFRDNTLIVKINKFHHLNN